MINDPIVTLMKSYSNSTIVLQCKPWAGFFLHVSTERNLPPPGCCCAQMGVRGGEGCWAHCCREYAREQGRMPQTQWLAGDFLSLRSLASLSFLLNPRGKSHCWAPAGKPARAACCRLREREGKCETCSNLHTSDAETVPRQVWVLHTLKRNSNYVCF